jgi:drug/metabolite transporter (DMT)-like permease
MSDILYGSLVVLSSFLFSMQPVLLKAYKYDTLLMCVARNLINCIVFISIALFYFSYNDISFSFIDYYTSKLQVVIQSLAFYASTIFAYTFPLLPTSISIPMFSLWTVLLDLFNKELYGIHITSGQYISFIVILAGVCLNNYSPVKKINTFSYTTIVLLLSGIITMSAYYSLLPSISYDNNTEIKNHVILEGALNGTLVSTGSLLGVLVLIGISQMFNTNKLPTILKITKLPSLKDALFILVGYFFTSTLVVLFARIGYDNLPTTTFAVLDNSFVLTSMLIGYFLLKEKISYQKIAGVIVVILGIGINIHYRNTKNDKMVLKPFYKKWLT